MSIRQNYGMTKVVDLSFAGIHQTFITDRGPPSTDTPCTLVDNVLEARIERIYDDFSGPLTRLQGGRL